MCIRDRRGVCGTGLRTFTIQSRAEMVFTALIEPETKDDFRFGIVVTDQNNSEGALVFTERASVKAGEQVVSPKSDRAGG